MSDFTTPADLSGELAVPAKRIREFLRAEYGKLARPETRWALDDSKEAAVRRRFTSK